MRRYLLIVTDDDLDDPQRIAAEWLASGGEYEKVADGYVAAMFVEPDGDDDDPARAANRARQARYRAKKRNASNAESNADRVTRNALEFEAFPGGVTPQPLRAGGSNGTAPGNAAVTPIDRNARNAVTRNAVTRDALRDDEVAPLTDDECEAGRAGIGGVRAVLAERRSSR